MANAQTNEWGWMGGSLTSGSLGVYGALGTPASKNNPGGRYGAATWTDSQGNFWLFGGFGIASGSEAYYGFLNDLWELNSATNEWTWVGGSNSLQANFDEGAGVYGTLGVAASGNVPPGRLDAASWVDSKGNLWLFGGIDFASTIGDYFNDLWEYSPSTNEWTWMGGSSKPGQAGVYGTIRKSATGNVPGARYEAVSWTDNQGNFWLFGGDGLDSTGALQNLNDLWEYNPATNQWIWMNGSSTSGAASVPGTQGTPAQGNTPGARNSSSGWTDHQGNLWLFGGTSANGNPGDPLGFNFNDLWELNPSTNEWVWISGSTAVGTVPGSGPSGTYGTLQTPSANSVPGARIDAATWTDGAGNLWLFGGQGYDSAGNYVFLNDLWEFNPATTDWTWMAGSSVVPDDCASYFDWCGEAGVYGILQTPGFGDVPGGRAQSARWTDRKGNLWLFGGQGVDAEDDSVYANYLDGYLSDLWEFQPNTNGLPVTATPDIAPGTGTYNSWQTVTIADTTSGATIYYLIDGITPASEYTGPITVTSSETIEAIASASGHANSNIATASYQATLSTAATPVFSIAAGNYSSAQSITISDATPGATIYYAIGAEPTATFAQYNNSTITVSSSETLQAYAVAEDYLTSAVAIAAYNVGSNPSGEWVWMGGTNTILPGCSQAGNCAIPGWYGSLGVSAATNVPGMRSSAVTWTDGKGNLWLFGGQGSDSADATGYLNDLWEFNPATAEWTWMGGSSTIPSCSSADGCGQSGTYGTLGTASVKNSPGARESAATWTDSKGNLWLFGGLGFDANGTLGFLNDLWKFDTSTNEWTWMGGSNSVSCTGCGQPGVYGEFAVPAAGNVPGGRDQALTWTDQNGNFWMFGGLGEDDIDIECYLNDLWEFNPSNNQWAWMGGYPTDYEPMSGYQGIYGEIGVPAVGNLPWSYTLSSTWIDSVGHLWLFGGIGEGDTATGYTLNDMWEFYPSLDEWAFTSTNSEGAPGGSTTSVYGTIGDFSPSNVPGERYASASWTDSGGNFWMLGGAGEVNQYPVTLGWLNDLWEFKPSLNQWAWMGGSISAPSGTWGAPGEYGTLGVPAPGNIPGGREFGAAWTDASGNLWLFGGSAVDAHGTQGSLNDLWEYDLAGPPTVHPPTPAATPTFSLVAGTYNSVQTLTISDQAAGATIYYTTNGATPNSSSAVYSAPIPVSTSETVEAVAVAAGDAESTIASATYTINLPAAATPTFSDPGGTYTAAQTVTISDATQGASIYYTSNGTTPTTSSIVYSSAITVSSTEMLQAIATASGYSNSAVASATYTISLPPSFTVTGTTVTVTPGATTGNTSTITVTPTGGFTGTVSLSCAFASNAATDPATCSIPASVTISGTTAQTTTLTVNTTAATAGSCSAANVRHKVVLWYTAGSTVLAWVLLFGIPARRRRWLAKFGMLALLIAITSGVLACGGSGGGGGCNAVSNPGTTAGDYTITVTGTSGTITEIGTIALTVQ
ncbi:MAG TPA: chitobiase/beta-hexosaminidase C-terminal domain-containing protein [Terracidiphilus sp.]|nr:chitobiase/beta-hexosaminidase C-terminal domain-containing protein [Terracidiphilus sp.]